MAINKSFSTYVAEVKSDYNYIIKFAIDDMTDAMVDKLERALSKYELKTASEFKKTPIQINPLDFPNVKNLPVFISDISLGYPASIDFLRTYISNSLGLSPANVVVYTRDDPRKLETELYVERTSPEYKEKYEPKLGSDYTDTDRSEMYGKEYNTEFLKELQKVAAERKYTKVYNSLSTEETEDHSTLPNGYHDFNDAKNVDEHQISLFGRIKRPPQFKVGK